MKADLHIHSIYSDSSRSPEEIAAVAKKNNVALVSICDHATINAYDRFFHACENENINCVLGVELGVSWKNEDLHVLAYNFDKNNTKMKTLIDEQHKDIECEYIIYNMIKDYPQISLEDYRNFEYPKEKGGWKYIHYAVAKGIAATYEHGNNFIYGKYSTPNHLSNLGECNLQDFCETVKQAGGVSILAHPGFLYDKNPDGIFEILKDIKNHGIEGIECYYPSHSQKFTDICVDFCKKNDMRITCGCDCHGDFDKSEGFTIGALDIPLNKLDLKGII